MINLLDLLVHFQELRSNSNKKTIIQDVRRLCDYDQCVFVVICSVCFCSDLVSSKLFTSHTSVWYKRIMAFCSEITQIRKAYINIYNAIIPLVYILRHNSSMAFIVWRCNFVYAYFSHDMLKPKCTCEGYFLVLKNMLIKVPLDVKDDLRPLFSSNSKYYNIPYTLYNVSVVQQKVKLESIQ